MNKFFLTFAAIVFGMSGYAQSLDSSPVFDKGDRKMDLMIGVGMVDYPGSSKATFDQHFGMEWGVAKLSNNLTLGLGFDINNMYGASFDGAVIGTYDYTYNVSTRGNMFSFQEHKWISANSDKEYRRQGIGSADAKIARDDIDALFVASLHFSPMSRLDTYLKVGLGVGVMNYVTGSYTNMQGFSKDSKYTENKTKYTDYTTSWSYDDLAHVKWEGYDTKVTPALAVYIGASYMLTDKWGVDMKFGLVNGNLKSGKNGYPSSYGILAFGASYRF